MNEIMFDILSVICRYKRIFFVRKLNKLFSNDLKFLKQRENEKKWQEKFVSYNIKYYTGILFNVLRIKGGRW